MKKIGNMICLLLNACLLLSGCSATATETAPPPDLVTKIAVSYDHQDIHLDRIYTDTDKMDVILFYLYSLSPYGDAEEDPELLTGERCKITVWLSSGQHKIYRQYAEQYLSIDSHPWQKIEEDQASVLYHLIRHIDSDK